MFVIAGLLGILRVGKEDNVLVGSPGLLEHSGRRLEGIIDIDASAHGLDAKDLVPEKGILLFVC